MCTVIALSGADCEEVRNYILNSINIFVNVFVYIQNEQVKLTKIKSGRRRREVALLHPHTHPLVSDYWADVVSALAKYLCYVQYTLWISGDVTSSYLMLMTQLLEDLKCGNIMTPEIEG